eukprot:11915324-Karenia_brevis.AAC.1
MPWEEILEQMRAHRADRNVLDTPRPQDCLKYMLFVHLQVKGVDLRKHLKQVMVRPFALPALLKFLMRKRRCTIAQKEHAHCS